MVPRARKVGKVFVKRGTQSQRKFLASSSPPGRKAALDNKIKNNERNDESLDALRGQAREGIPGQPAGAVAGSDADTC